MPALESDKHERFCQEYVVDLNQTEAYIRAGYAENGARQNASRLMAHDDIRQRISELKHERGQRLGITQESVIFDLESLKTQAAAAGNFGPAVKAAELQGKHFGMWPTKIDLSGSVALGDLVKKAHQK